MLPVYEPRSESRKYHFWFPSLVRLHGGEGGGGGGMVQNWHTENSKNRGFVQLRRSVGFHFGKYEEENEEHIFSTVILLKTCALTKIIIEKDNKPSTK